MEERDFDLEISVIWLQVNTVHRRIKNVIFLFNAALVSCNTNTEMALKLGYIRVTDTLTDSTIRQRHQCTMNYAS